MHRLFDEFIDPVFTKYRPKRLLEIGVLHGKNTYNILKWCDREGATLTSLDPVDWIGELPDDVREGMESYKYKRGQEHFDNWQIKPEGLEAVFAEGLQRHWSCLKMRSLDYFVSPQVESFDAYLVDGDHNYFTVITELLLIHRYAKKNTLIVLHDVAKTTNARKDEYYDPTFIPADQIDGPKQGILTAIEDFLAMVGGRGFGNRFFAQYEFDILTSREDGLGLLIRR